MGKKKIKYKMKKEMRFRKYNCTVQLKIEYFNIVIFVRNVQNQIKIYFNNVFVVWRQEVCIKLLKFLKC